MKYNDEFGKVGEQMGGGGGVTQRDVIGERMDGGGDEAGESRAAKPQSGRARPHVKRPAESRQWDSERVLLSSGNICE